MKKIFCWSKKFARLAVFALAIIFAPQVSATLIGAEVNGCLQIDTAGECSNNMLLNTGTTKTVTSSTQFSYQRNGVQAQADFSAGNTLNIMVNDAYQNNLDWGFTGFEWRDEFGELVDGIISVSLITNPSVGGADFVDNFRLTYDSQGVDGIFLRTRAPGASSKLAVFQFGFSENQSQIPEINVLALFGIGVAGLVFTRRRYL